MNDIMREDGLSLLEDRMRICKIEGCENKYSCKGYCQMHYTRLLRHGDPLFTKKGRDQEKHGKRHTSEYMTWTNIIQRCYNKNSKQFHYYGGRGITVCGSWRNSFLAFFKDMGSKPFYKAQIDRIDNDGNYEPGNCRWVTAQENCHNRSTTILTWEIVNKIRRKYKIGRITHRELGVIYGVRGVTIKDVLNYRRWKI